MSIVESVLRYGPSSWHRIDLYGPGDQQVRSRIVLFHGGFWRHDRIARDLEPLAVALVRRDRAVAVVEYRPVWDGGSWPGAADDAALALGALSAHDPAWDDAVLAGHSAGAHLAMSAAAGQGAGRGLVLLAPVVDLDHAVSLDVGGGAVTHFAGPHLASGGTLAEATPRPDRADVATLAVVRAGSDQAVPDALTDLQLADWRTAGLGPVEHVVPDARHMHLVNPDRPGCSVTLELLAPAAGALS
ncbi:alpha/beta hydrolase fold domain-containing protein [Streptomyces sp. NPDC058052]|uniref:alpha/beta hydrolase fold domain-containing protein n=1 Tax=Streptomyces sp. NPDC058052 TaxID=3346316 RepID=UPI0036E704A5